MLIDLKHLSLVEETRPCSHIRIPRWGAIFFVFHLIDGQVLWPVVNCMHNMGDDCFHHVQVWAVEPTMYLPMINGSSSKYFCVKWIQRTKHSTSLQPHTSISQDSTNYQVRAAKLNTGSLPYPFSLGWIGSSINFPFLCSPLWCHEQVKATLPCGNGFCPLCIVCSQQEAFIQQRFRLHKDRCVPRLYLIHRTHVV